MRSDTETTVFLWGPPAVGKSTIGRRLARTLKRRFFDTDALVVKRAGISIPTIFSEYGEAAFRALESRALVEAAAVAGAIVALGGGAVIAAENRALVARTGRSIHLRASIATIEARLRVAHVPRPLFTAGVTVSSLIAERAVYYNSADLCVDVDRRRPQDVVAEICARLQL